MTLAVAGGESHRFSYGAPALLLGIKKFQRDFFTDLQQMHLTSRSFGIL